MNLSFLNSQSKLIPPGTAERHAKEYFLISSLKAHRLLLMYYYTYIYTYVCALKIKRIITVGQGGNYTVVNRLGNLELSREAIGVHVQHKAT